MIGAWALAIIYDRVKVNTGNELTVLLVVSIIVMTVGLYLFCRKPKKTDKGEA
jgi:hypothetical protein